MFKDKNIFSKYKNLSPISKITIWGIIISTVITILSILFSSSEKTVQTANNNSNSAITQVIGDLNINNIATYAWVDENSWKDKIKFYRPNEHRYYMDLNFLANGPILPPSFCFNIKTDVKIIYISTNDVAYFSHNEILPGIPSIGLVCLDRPTQKESLYIELEEWPNIFEVKIE